MDFLRLGRANRACRGYTAPPCGPGGPRMTGWPGFLRWVPFAAALAWLGWGALHGTLRPDLAHLLGAGLAGAAWLAARRHGVTALLVALLLAPLAWHFAIALPATRRALLQAVTYGDYVRLEGTVRGRSEPAPGVVRLLLGDVMLWVGGSRQTLAELETDLPAHSAWAFPYRSRQRIGGVPLPGATGVSRVRGRLRLSFEAAEHYQRVWPVRPWSGEALRLRLRDRAAYYLSRSALAVYLPVVLGLRERDTPEARQVAGAFRRVGVAHLFAISGLHVGLLYLLFAALVHWGLGWMGWLRRSQGSVHGPALRRAVALAAVWAYIALIGFPVPAVRAALMGTLLLWNEQWGTRSPPLYILGLTALGLLAFDPSQLYDVSFQLSFLAYLFLLCALGLYRPGAGRTSGTRWSRWLSGLVEGARLNLWLTALITLGLWPLVAVTFGRVSLLVFLGNLVMVPLLGAFVLPLGLAALLASLAVLGTAPGGWLEPAVFAALDAVLRSYVWLVERLDTLSGYGVIPVRLTWPPQAFVAYYALLLAMVGWALHRRQARMRPSNTAS